MHALMDNTVILYVIHIKLKLTNIYQQLYFLVLHASNSKGSKEMEI